METVSAEVTLSFKEKPDYEMPGDRNRDNVYEVTVRASDGTMNADRALIIKVINKADEGGTVTVTPADAVVGVELTATLTHMEGGVSASGQIANADVAVAEGRQSQLIPTARPAPTWRTRTWAETLLRCDQGRLHAWVC